LLLNPTPYAPQASNAKIAADLGITAPSVRLDSQVILTEAGLYLLIADVTV